MSHCFNI